MFLMFLISEWVLQLDHWYGGGFCAIDFVDTMNGWVCGDYGTIYRTRDGGWTWERQTTGDILTFNGISFIDTLRGWICGDAGYIARTDDGGKTWVKQNSGVKSTLYDIVFIDERHGWCGSYREILRTIDGGRIWEPVLSDSGWCRNISPVNRNIVWASVLFSGVYVSYDGGINWVKKKDLKSHHCVFAVNERVIYISSSNGYLYKSTDGGETFDSFPRPSADISCALFFVSDNEG